MTHATAPYRSRLRGEILDIAERTVANDGLAALQARRIAAEAGCSVGTIYNVFGDLDGLVLAVNGATLEMLAVPLQGAFQQTKGKTPRDRLLALAEAYAEFAIRNQTRWRAVFEHKLPPERDAPPDYRANRERLLALIEDVISSDIPDALARSCAARALFAAVHGIVALALDNKIGAFDTERVRAEIRFIVSAAAAGLRQ